MLKICGVWILNLSKWAYNLRDVKAHGQVQALHKYMSLKHLTLKAKHKAMYLASELKHRPRPSTLSSSHDHYYSVVTA